MKKIGILAIGMSLMALANAIMVLNLFSELPARYESISLVLCGICLIAVGLIIIRWHKE